MKALDIASTGLLAQQNRIDVISNNLANMSTTAYAARRAEFVDLMYQNYIKPGSQTSDSGSMNPTGIQLGVGVKLAAISRDDERGTLKNTNNELDIAIDGKGYFQIQLPDGRIAYTRDGSFKKTPDGYMITSSGFKVEPEIVFPDNTRKVSINSEGDVYAYLGDNTYEPQLLGRINIVNFTNEKGLEAVGNNLMLQTEASGEPMIGDAGVDGRGILYQGYLENSSVDVVREITNLIEAQRGYEMNTKIITASDQMLGALTQIR